VLMDKQCDSGTQQKLIDYVHNGGKLIVAGRMCTEEFNHHPCTVLMDAIGIKHLQTDAPFIEKYIQVFEYKGVPVNFLETYTGDFDEVFARNEEDGVVGFSKTIGQGLLTMFGAAMYTQTLEDINIVHQLALKAGCPPLFILDDWADVRISCGEKGDFLFVNNYQDDPVETTIEYGQKLLFGGRSLSLPARRGLIIPLDWQLNENVTIHYLTTEITEVKDAGLMIRIDLAQEEFYAELSLVGYHFAHAVKMLKPSHNDRVRVHGRRGFIELIKDEK
jgi:beta-galactosidase